MWCQGGTEIIVNINFCEPTPYDHSPFSTAKNSGLNFDLDLKGFLCLWWLWTLTLQSCWNWLELWILSSGSILCFF